VLLEMDAGAEDIAWSPDGQYIAATRNGSVCIIDIATGEERLIESGPVELYSVVWFTVPVLPDDRPGSAGPH
jgi:WD40 repeat protein